MRRLVILRPQPGADSSVERARARGMNAEALPLFEIEPAGWTAPDAEGFDALLLTSANAVRTGGPGLKSLQSLPVLAVGEATAEAARSAGLTIERTGNGGVEALLSGVPNDRRLLHLAGADHRDPGALGHSVMTIAVYRSRPLALDGLADQIAGAVVAVHSPAAAARLAELVEIEQRATVAVVAISPAAAEAAGCGWQSVESASEPSDPALLALAARLCKNDGE